MENPSTHYIARVLKRLLDISWYVVWLLAIIMLGMFVVFSATETNELSFTCPVEVSSGIAWVGGNEFTENAGLQATLKAEVFHLVIKDTSIAFYSLGLIEVFIYLGVVLAIIYWLRAIFANILEGQPFVLENAYYIRYMGWVVLLLFPLKFIRVLFYRDYIEEAAATAGYQLQAWFPFFNQTLQEGELRMAVDYQLEAVVVGLLLLVLAEVFRKGVSLKSENEAFV